MGASRSPKTRALPRSSMRSVARHVSHDFAADQHAAGGDVRVDDALFPDDEGVVGLDDALELAVEHGGAAERVRAFHVGALVEIRAELRAPVVRSRSLSPRQHERLLGSRHREDEGPSVAPTARECQLSGENDEAALESEARRDAPETLFVLGDSDDRIDVDRYLQSTLHAQHLRRLAPLVAAPTRWFAIDPVWRYFRRLDAAAFPGVDGL